MKKIIAIYLLLFSVSFCFANETPLSKKKWEDLTKELNYERIKEEPKEEKPETAQTEPQYKRPSTNFGNVKYLFMAIVIVLLIVLIGFMIVNSKANPALNNHNIAIEKIEKLEEHIHEVNLEDLFAKYVEATEYAMAIRISFLKIIKALSEQKRIKWEKQRTNWEYYNQLNDFDMKIQFGQMINHFERVWYGEMAISVEQFNEINDQFESFKLNYIEISDAA